MRNIILFSMITVAVSGCKSTEPLLTPTPEYLATAYERKPLVVEHRDWITEGCYPSRQQVKGKWTEIKICDKK